MNRSSIFATASLVRQYWRTAYWELQHRQKRFLPKYAVMRASLSSLKPHSFPTSSLSIRFPALPHKTELRMQISNRALAWHTQP